MSTESVLGICCFAIHVILASSGKAEDLVPMLFDQEQDFSDDFFLLSLIVTKSVPVDMNMQTAGTCLVRAVAHFYRFMQESLPVHVMLMIVKRHWVRNDLEAVVNTAIGLDVDMKCSPFVRQYGIIEIYQLKSLTKGGIFMPKGQPNKRYTPEFKIKVVETMHREKLSYRETARQFDIPNSRVTAWERIYLEEGAEGLYVERRGRKSTGRSPKIKKEVEEDLIAEVQRLRAENAYLKKLNALVAERVRQEKKHK